MKSVCTSVIFSFLICLCFFNHKFMFSHINQDWLLTQMIPWLGVKIEWVNRKKERKKDCDCGFRLCPDWQITYCPESDRHLLFLRSWTEFISKLSWNILHLALHISIIALFSNRYECLLSFFLFEHHKDKGLIVVFLHRNQLYAGERLAFLKLITLLNAGDLPNVDFLEVNAVYCVWLSSSISM